MSNKVSIPVLLDTPIEEEASKTVGEPASIIGNFLQKSAIKEIASIDIDEVTLHRLISSITSLVKSIKEISGNSESTIKADSISFQVGITKSGKAALLGSGVDIKMATVIQVGFKIV